MGGLRKYLPYTFWCMTIATFAMPVCRHLPAFRKTAILWVGVEQWHSHYWLIGVITAGMTSFYMFRCGSLTFFGEYRGPILNRGARNT